MAKTPKKEETKDERSAKETERIAAKTLKSLLNTPPRPYTPPKDKGVREKPKK